jgi:hypothetical protein
MVNKMTKQQQFIEFVVENLLTLTEAYGKAEVEKLVKKFKDQAEALGVLGKNKNPLTDDEIKAIIDGFDQIRTTSASSIPVEKRDINKWKIKDLIKFVSDKINMGGDEEEEEVDQTPDVVYDDPNYTIWNGSKEGNCIKYGKGERWCITKGSFGSYRYSQQRGYPVFYLIKNKNLPESDTLSFVAIQVRNKPENQRYVFTNRKNNPYESNEMGWDELTSRISWLTNIPDVKDKLKYIGIGKAEQRQKTWSSYSGLSENEFDSLSFNEKKAYLSIRKEQRYVIQDGDVTHSDFIQDFLPDYPELKKWVADFPFEYGFKPIIFNFDEFTPQQQKSIAVKVNNVEHGGNDIDGRGDGSVLIELGIKNIIKLLEYNPKAFPPTNDSCVGLVKLDGDDYIVQLLHSNNILTVKYLKKSTGWERIKLNSYSEDLLFNHPFIKSVPFAAIANAIGTYNLSPKKIGGLLYKIQNPKEGEDVGSLSISEVDDKKILFDLNGLTPSTYDITNNKISKLDLSSEENQNIRDKFLELTKTNDNFKISLGINLIRNKDKAGIQSPTEIYDIFKDAPKEIYDAIYQEQTNDTTKQFIYPTEQGTVIYSTIGRKYLNGKTSIITDQTDINNFITAVKKSNFKFNDENINNLLSTPFRESNTFSKLLVSTPDFQSITVDGNAYKYKTINDEIYRYVPTNLANSNKWSFTSGRWIRGTVRPQDIGQAAPAANAAAPAAGGRRGRPAGAARAPQAAPAAPAAGGTPVANIFAAANLTTGYNSLPRGARRRLEMAGATQVNVRGDRGSSARQNQLGNSGRVTAAYSINSGGQQPTKIYLITMASGATIASINIQPGNYNYIVTSTGFLIVNNPRQLMTVLQGRNITEGMKSFIIKNYLSLNPHQLDEVKAMLKTHTSNKKN